MICNLGNLCDKLKGGYRPILVAMNKTLTKGEHLKGEKQGVLLEAMQQQPWNFHFSVPLERTSTEQFRERDIAPVGSLYKMLNLLI